MSFDLGVWKSGRALSRAEADEIFGRLCESELSVVEPTPAMEQFYTMLTRRYPELDEVPENEMDRSPWSARLDVSDRHVAMSIVWSRAKEVAAFVRELAAEYDLVCYDPQVPEVHYPTSLSEQPRLRLYSEDGTELDAPSADAIVQLIQSLTQDGNYFAVFERTDTRYLQAALSEDGVFAIEYRDGGPEWHYRCEPVSREQVVDAFQSYAQQDDQWRDMFDWQHLEV